MTDPLDELKQQLRDVAARLNKETDVATARVLDFERFLAELSVGLPIEVGEWSYRRWEDRGFRVCVLDDGEIVPFAEASRAARLSAFRTFEKFAHGLLSEAKKLVES